MSSGSKAEKNLNMSMIYQPDLAIYWQPMPPLQYVKIWLKGIISRDNRQFDRTFLIFPTYFI
jgi:hypothetical protein